MYENVHTSLALVQVFVRPEVKCWKGLFLFNIFIYKTKLVYTFGFHESAIFSLIYIKVCLRHDLSTHVESARLVT